jgi:hypothetical protein
MGLDLGVGRGELVERTTRDIDQVRPAGRRDSPSRRLSFLAAGHAPWLGHPDRVATLVSDFVH